LDSSCVRGFALQRYGWNVICHSVG
jgi:hypothetical protein